MFGFKRNSNARTPQQPRTMITPNNYGYSHTFIDDADSMVLEWEFNGGIPTPEMLSKARELAPERLEAANRSDELKEHLSSLSDSNARIISNLSATKSKVAQGAKRQYDAWMRHFGNMDKLESGYDLSRARRDAKINDIRESFDYAVANLRVNRSRRSAQRAQRFESVVQQASHPPKKKRKQAKV